MGPELELLLPLLDERARRLVLGAVARAAGEGGTAAVASVAGASWQTVANGAAELASGDSAAPGRVRRPGAGRKKLADSDPGLVPALRALLEESTRGDPCSPLMWTTLSLRDIAAGLAAQGYRCGKNAVARLLAAQGFSLQGNSRAIEGRRHPDRDAQFRYVNERAKEFLAAGDPVISVDTKKKEPVGQYASRGRSWRPRGEPVRVRDHDFPDPGEGVAIPYGIYDVSANAGFVNVGTDHDTPAFAAESIRRWWQDIGAGRYPGTRRLLVTCDAERSDEVAAAVRGLGSAGLQVTVRASPDASPGAAPGTRLGLVLTGGDRPGIIRDVSRVLAERGVNVEELESEVSSAPMSGERLFTARARLRVPPSLTIADLRASLERLAGEFMVDLTTE